MDIFIVLFLGMFFILPWQKWLPPYIVGPAISIASLWLFEWPLPWWMRLFQVFGVIFGVIGTLKWLSDGKNIFK